jgi:hypothetical protein
MMSHDVPVNSPEASPFILVQLIPNIDTAVVTSEIGDVQQNVCYAAERLSLGVGIDGRGDYHMTRDISLPLIEVESRPVLSIILYNI